MSNSFPPPITSSRWGARTKRLVAIFTLILLGFVVWNLVDVLPFLIVASLLSYVLWPLVNLIEERFLVVVPFETRSLSVTLAFLVMVAVFVVVLIVIVPVLVDQISDFGQAFPRFINTLEADLEELLSRPIAIGGRPVPIGGEPVIPLELLMSITGSDTSSLRFGQTANFDIFQVIGAFIGSVGGLTGSAFNVLGGALNVIFNSIFLLFVMFYLMRDGDQFTQQLVNIVPESYQGDMRRFLYELGRVWNAYLRGQLILSVTMGFVVYIAALILGVPNAPILGLLAGLLEFIPTLGPFIALIPAVLTALVSQSGTFPFLSGAPFALVVIIVWTSLQQLESMVLVPRVMGGSLNLHPVVVILAVVIGASIGGALGVILAAPFVASLRLLGQYLYGKMFDANPFPNPKPPPENPHPVQRFIGGLHIMARRILRVTGVPRLIRMFRREIPPHIQTE